MRKRQVMWLAIFHLTCMAVFLEVVARAPVKWASLKGELYDLDNAPQDHPAPKAGQQKA
jgi:hypothetical protein